MVVLVGYMSIVSPFLLYCYTTINVHPANLTILDENGKRKFVGKDPVRDAILAGEDSIRSTVHLVNEKVDDGAVLMVSAEVAYKPKSRF